MEVPWHRGSWSVSFNGALGHRAPSQCISLTQQGELCWVDGVLDHSRGNKMEDFNKKLGGEILGDGITDKDDMTIAEKSRVEDPFKRSAKLSRSPVRKLPDGQVPEHRDLLLIPQVSRILKQRVRSASLDNARLNLTALRAEREGVQEKVSEVDAPNDLDRMCSILEIMHKATERQRNTSMDIKNGINELKEITGRLRTSWEMALREKAPILPPESSDVEKVDEPLTPGTRRKRDRESLNGDEQRKRTNSEIAPRKLSTSPEALSTDPLAAAPVQQEKNASKDQEPFTLVVKKRRERNNKNKNNEQKAVTNTTTPGASVSTEYVKEPAKTEKARKLKKKGRVKKRLTARADAILIKPQPGKTYADVLGSIRKEASVQKAGAELKAIRQTRSGDVLIELGPSGKGKSGLTDAIKKVVDKGAKVRTLNPTISLEIRDLDSVTTAKEVQNAIQRDLKEKDGNFTVHVTEPNSRALRKAFVTLSETRAVKLLNNGHIKVGLVSCRVRRRVEVTRCFKCLGYGHLAKVCKGPDRSKACFRCGSEQHQAANCKETPKCGPCAELKLEEKFLKHKPGTKECEALRRALPKRS